MTISPPSTTNHSTKKAVYLQAFDKYFNSLPSEDPSTSPLNPASPPSLNSKLNYNALPKNTNFIAEEKEHLRFLSERFGDKLPYLRDRLAEFIEKHPDPNDTATVIMPSNKEDQATGHLTDQVARESSDSTASTHPMHQVSTGATEGKDTGHMKDLKEKASAQDHNATPGPVQTDKMPEAQDKETLKAKAAEMNK